MSDYQELVLRKSVAKYEGDLYRNIIAGIAASAVVLFIDWRYIFIVAGLFTVVCIAQYVGISKVAADRNPQIRIDDAGVWLITVKETIPWSDIQDMRFLHRTKIGWCLGVTVANTELFRNNSWVDERIKAAIIGRQELVQALANLDAEREDIKRAVDQWRPGLLEV